MVSLIAKFHLIIKY